MFRTLDYLGLPTSEAARKIYELHIRNARQACQAISGQIKKNADKIRRGEIHPRSLLAMITSQSTVRVRDIFPHATFPTPEGAKWKDVRIDIVSKDSARVTVCGVTKTYSALDMGFKDRRRGDMLTQQWDLLVKFAECSGVLSWANPIEKKTLYKTIQSLKSILKTFLGISGPPIKNYEKAIGYVARFKIEDKSFGKS